MRIQIMKRYFHPKPGRPEAGFYSVLRTSNNFFHLLCISQTKNVFFSISPRRVSTSRQFFYQMLRSKIEKANICLWAFKIISFFFFSCPVRSDFFWNMSVGKAVLLKENILHFNHKENIREAQDPCVLKTRQAHPMHYGAGKALQKPQQNAWLSHSICCCIPPSSWPGSWLLYFR